MHGAIHANLDLGTEIFVAAVNHGAIDIGPAQWEKPQSLANETEFCCATIMLFPSYEVQAE
jgi:hypothetical protein